VSSNPEPGFPRGTSDERELFLRWLRFLRGAVIRKVEGLSDEQARWTPDGALICLLGIINHLTHVEWRWIDGGILGQDTSRSARSGTHRAGCSGCLPGAGRGHRRHGDGHAS